VYRPVPALGEKEKEQIEYLLDNGVSALVVTPGNPKLATPLINRAEKKGVRVICTTTDAPRSRRSSVVGLDPGLSGRLAAELMAKFLPPRSQVAVITGMLATEEHRRKAEGFRSAFRKQCPGGVPVAVVEAHESEDESYRKTLALLRDFPELRGLYVSTVNCMPVCEALHQSGLAGNIRLITTDLFLRMVPYLERGTIAASIYQDPYLQGQLAVRLLADYFLHGTAIPPTCYLNPGVVLRTNLRLFRECAQ
jgi:LacI family transcriptional regulator